MPDYVTWESSRNRFVFQIRVPAEIRFLFGNRSTIRKHLGDISQGDALAKAQQFASHYKGLFAQHASTTKQSTQARVRPPSHSLILMDEDIDTRFSATWLTRQSMKFIQEMESLRRMPDDAWNTKIKELKNSMLLAREDLRRRNQTEVRQAISDLESNLVVRFEGSIPAFDALTDRFNDTRVRFISDCIAVLGGQKAASSLVPDASRQLPLVELWGTPALQLVERWRETTLLRKGVFNLRTFDKYHRIAVDLRAILARRPIELTTEADLRVLIERWRKCGNQPPTVKDKLDILKCLLRPLLPTAWLQSLFEPFRWREPVVRAARMPFTDVQLRQFCASVFYSEAVDQNDKALLAMLLLVAGRIEEVYQLRSTDLETTSDGWIVRIADGRQTGHGDAHLKNGASARRIPIKRDAVPLFDAWLEERISEGGFLFPNGSKSSKGPRSGAASKRLNRLVRKLFPDDQRLVLQSTRNTSSRVMRRLGIDPRVRTRLLGHADVRIHDRHYDPGLLLDDRDLESGSRAIADYLRSILGIENGSPI